ncbi:MAG: family 16 glycosylhydrolase [Gemmatimonadota bacterium]|nr:MAG: family 16 glycosylhydrolase [Gemmatimonadota bacterium]
MEHPRATTDRSAACVGVVLMGGLLMGGCTEARPDTDVAWAINVGGPAYDGMDGTRYEAEASVSGGTPGRLETVEGTQDPVLYATYRAGDIRVDHPMANGTYDITFHFAEPERIGAGERLFDTFAEGRRAIDDLDVMLFRDGRVQSALTVTVPNVVVADGELNIAFEASAGEPLLSALVVREKNRPKPTWELVWNDEFDGDELDDAKWTIDVWPPRKVNDEDQAYTARAKNLRVEDGTLVIQAHREDHGEAEYTSGRVHSSGKGDFRYGRFEVRAILPRGQGTWPAIWMLPSDPFAYATTCDDGDWQGNSECDAWPNSGEIDIMEHVGYQMNHVHGTVHTKAYYWLVGKQRKGRILLDDVADAFHVYAVEWTPERIDVFVDDTRYFSYVNEHDSWREWPFDKPFHLVLNVAVGGAWGRAGGPIDDAIFPQRMRVDYVRVYRKPE